MEINKITLSKFRKDFNEAVAELSKKHGLAISMGNISFSNDGFSSKVTFDNVGQLDEGQSLEQAQFEKHAPSYGFLPESFNQIVLIGGKRHKFVGFKPNATKNCCVIKDTLSGKKYVTTQETMKRALR